MRKEGKRGVVVEYAVVLMLVVTVFGVLIVTVAAQATKYSDAYGIYLERKMFLDEIGRLSEQKYIDGLEIDFNEYLGENNAFGYTVTDDDRGKVTVEGKESILLTVIYRRENNSWRLVEYVYGKAETGGEVSP